MRHNCQWSDFAWRSRPLSSAKPLQRIHHRTLYNYYIVYRLDLTRCWNWKWNLLLPGHQTRVLRLGQCDWLDFNKERRLWHCCIGTVNTIVLVCVTTKGMISAHEYDVRSQLMALNTDDKALITTQIFLKRFRISFFFLLLILGIKNKLNNLSHFFSKHVYGEFTHICVNYYKSFHFFSVSIHIIIFLVLFYSIFNDLNSILKYWPNTHNNATQMAIETFENFKNIQILCNDLNNWSVSVNIPIESMVYTIQFDTLFFKRYY